MTSWCDLLEKTSLVGPKELTRRTCNVFFQINHVLYVSIPKGIQNEMGVLSFYKLFKKLKGCY
jgi:hypothetical protein